MKKPHKISWTEQTWNPITGCTRISEGCANCYAENMTRRYWQQWKCEPPPDHFKIAFHPNRLEQPLHWREPRMIFVCSMGDLFHEDCELEWIENVFDIIKRCPQHTFQILTKRPQNMYSYMFRGVITTRYSESYPLSNVWLGVTVENERTYIERMPLLLQTRGAVRFVSFEPLLEGLYFLNGEEKYLENLDWAVIGAESIGGRPGRPCKFSWVRSIVAQCQKADVPVFIKQLHIMGQLVKDVAQFPKELQIREYPNIKE